MPRRSNIIALSSDHPDPDVAQKVLRVLIDRYLEMHIEVHRSVGWYEFLTKQTDLLRFRLAETEEELRKRKQAGWNHFVGQIQRGHRFSVERLHKALYEAEAEIAERQARVQQMEQFSSKDCRDPARIPPHKRLRVQHDVAHYRKVAGILETCEEGNWNY